MVGTSPTRASGAPKTGRAGRRDESHWIIRPAERTRRVRGGFRPESQRPGRAPDRRKGHRGADEPAAPRRDGGGSGHGRRRGAADPDSGRLFPGRGRAAGLRAAGAGPLWRGFPVPAAGRQGTGRREGGGAADLARRRPVRAGLARSADGSAGGGTDGAGLDAVVLAGVRRGAEGAALRRRARTQAAGRAQARRTRTGAQGRGQFPQRLRSELLVPHAGLQGHDDRPAGAEVLSGPDGRAHGQRRGGGAPALFDEHVSLLAAGAALPHAGAQRRNQHPARQPQRDGRARAQAEIRGVRPRRREAAADPRGFRQRQREPRQRARVADAGRAGNPPRDADADPAGLGREISDGPGPARVLRVPRGTDGTVGRAGGGGVHRRAAGRRVAGSQRPAPGALRGDQGRLHGAGVRGRRAGPAGGPGGGKRLAPARHDAAGGPGDGAPDEGRRDQDAPGAAAAVPPLGRGKPHRHPWFLRRGGRARRAGRRTGPEAPPVRLYPRRRAPHPRRDGDERRGTCRLDGQRPAAGGALREAAALLLVFQAALRADHQPADRFDPRGAGDVADDIPGAQPGHPERKPGARAVGEAAASNPVERGFGADPQPEPRRVPVGHAADGIRCAGHRARRGAGARAGRTVRTGVERGPVRHQSDRAERPRPAGRPRADSGAVGDGGGEPGLARNGVSHGDGAADRDGRSARNDAHGAAAGLRCGGDQSLPGFRDGGRAGADERAERADECAEGVAELHQGAEQGPDEDHVQDGHFDVAQLPQRTGLRGGGPGAVRAGPLLHGDGFAGGGHRALRDRQRGPGAGGRREARAGGGAAAGGRAVRVAGGRRAAPVDGAEHQRAATEHAHGRLGALQDLRGADQRTGREAEHATRAVRDQAGRSGGAAGRGRAGRSDPAPLHDGRDELRLAGPGSARDAGDRDEPHRRAQQQRRRRRRSGALRRRARRRQPLQRDQADRQRALRRHGRIPQPRAGAADQDRAGREARRRRPAAGPQGNGRHRARAAFHAGRHVDFAAAAPRHLFH